MSINESSMPAVQVALVTGASRGIGKAIALRLGKMPGVTVVGTATSEKGQEIITHYLNEANIKGCGIVLDVTSSRSVEEAIANLTERVGSPSILVNNAGITHDNLFLRMNIEEWSKVLDANLTGTYRLLHACIRPMMRQRYGRVVNISSVVGSMGNAGQANYAASKAGMIGLTKSLAKEVGSRGVTVNVVAPGFIDTDMTRTFTEAQRAKLLEQIPIPRMGQPEEVAHAVAFLVSKEAAYITGETMHVNGGMYMC